MNNRFDPEQPPSDEVRLAAMTSEHYPYRGGMIVKATRYIDPRFGNENRWLIVEAVRDLAECVAKRWRQWRGTKGDQRG